MLDLLPAFEGPKSEILVNIESFHQTPAARYKALRGCYDQAMAHALAKDHRARLGVFNANSYSGTLVTAFLEEGSITDLVNAWAYLDAFSIATELDPRKPLAAGIVKHVTGGESTQTNPTNFEPAGGSMVNPLTITPSWLNQPMRVSAGDLNNGLQVDDLRQKAIAAFADSMTVLATAPISAATFTATPLVRAPAGFNLSDTATLQGQLQKSPKKNLILDGTYLSRITNQPGYFQKTGTSLDDSGGYMPYGWNGIHLASNWSGAGANIRGFACNPQAIVRATGLPASFNTAALSVKEIELPGLNVVIAMSQWLSLGSRTFFVSFDVIAGFTAADATAGIVIANGTPG